MGLFGSPKAPSAPSGGQKDSLSSRGGQKTPSASPGGQKATPPPSATPPSSRFWGSKEKELKGIPRSEVAWKGEKDPGAISDSGLATNYLSREKRAEIIKKIPGKYGPWISKRDIESHVKDYDKKIYEAKTGTEKDALRHERDWLKKLTK